MEVGNMKQKVQIRLRRAVKVVMELGRMTKKIKTENEYAARKGKRMIFRGSEESFMENGKLLLEERVTLFHGKTNPIRCLSIRDLNTQFEGWNFHCDGPDLKWYQCVWEGRPILVKVFRPPSHSPEICREIAVATQMATHNNVHKLLACCLETIRPVLIYEFVEHGNLQDAICTSQNHMIPVLGWKDRLRIAWEISHAVAYLHSAFPRPIIHRDLKPGNVFLDQDNAAKLIGFENCVSIPKGESYVEAEIRGTFGFLDPAYFETQMLAENADVYSFGVSLLVLLTVLNPAGRSLWWNSSYFTLCHSNVFRYKHFTEIVDPVIIRDAVMANEDLQQQMQACIEIVLKCVALEKDSRPTMEEVAAELKSIITASELSIPGTGSSTRSQNLSLSHVKSESKSVIFHGNQQNFIKNESILLGERASLFQDMTNPICYLSIDDLNNNFKDWSLYSKFGAWRWYQCVWEGRPVLAKLFQDSLPGSEIVVGCCREIAVATQMGVHKNVHKLLACCLETEKPVLIYEFVENGCLHDVIFRSQNQVMPLLAWKDRLRIAWEISSAVVYLHSAFPRPIVHRDLKPMNVYLDQENAAKLSNFSASVSIPEGEGHVENTIIGTLGYTDPEYLRTKLVTRSVDVYSFGVFFLVLLTGLRATDREFSGAIYSGNSKCFTELVDPVITGYGVMVNEDLQQQLQACIEIAVKCIAIEIDCKPTMEEVTAELKNIITSSEASILPATASTFAEVKNVITSSEASSLSVSTSTAR